MGHRADLESRKLGLSLGERVFGNDPNHRIVWIES